MKYLSTQENELITDLIKRGFSDTAETIDRLAKLSEIAKQLLKAQKWSNEVEAELKTHIKDS